MEFWGVFDNTNNLSDAIQEYARRRRGATINYKSFNPEDYEREVINALATGRGPDVMYLHNTWLPKHKDKLVPMPQSNEELAYYTLPNFRDDFVDVAYGDLVDDGQIYALPLFMDTLALFYNKDLLNSAGISSPPRTWSEFNDAVERLTTLDERGRFVKSGAVIGTARNVNRSTDILMLLMLQSGIPMADRDRGIAEFSRDVGSQDAGEVTLQYYTDFANPLKRVYTWNDDQIYSIDAFVEERAAMMFNYSYNTQLFRSKAPRLNFGIAPMPQIEDTAVVVDYANYWAPAVTINSKFPLESWKFLQFLASREGATIYLNKAKRPSARRDLIDLQKSDLDLGVFANQSLSARSWYQIDSGEIERIFADMIDDVNFGRKSVSEALRSAQNKVTLLMQK